jgi:hypothetical protein
MVLLQEVVDVHDDDDGRCRTDFVVVTTEKALVTPTRMHKPVQALSSTEKKEEWKAAIAIRSMTDLLYGRRWV